MLVILITKILIPRSFDFLLLTLHILWEGIASAIIIIIIILITCVLLSLIYQLHKTIMICIVSFFANI